nr:hypothetical protein [uncultured Flavobacterium sp.]
MNYNIKLILEYFISRGWNIHSEGKIFLSLKAPERLKLPEGFYLDIPKDSNLQGFSNYISRFLTDYVNIFPDAPKDELELLFSENVSFIKYRIFDNDNEDGTISLNKYVKSIDTFKNVLEDAVSFTVNKKHIYCNTNKESSEYLRNCRVMQSVKGSFVNRFEVKSQALTTTFNEITTDQVNQKLFDVLNFVKEDILVNINRPQITENYISDNADLINYELLNSIKSIYTKTHISNIEYILEGNKSNRSIVTEKMTAKIKYFENYLTNLKSILQEVILFEATGYATTLNSTDPIKSDRNEVILDGKKFGIKKPIKIYLRSEEYLSIMDAHKNHQPIRISGKIKELKTTINVKELEHFEILPHS